MPTLLPLRKVAATIEAFISRTATSSSTTVAPTLALRLPFSEAADTYPVCSLSAALLIAPHVDHPDGSTANTEIYGEAGAFFVESTDGRALYDGHFVRRRLQWEQQRGEAGSLDAVKDLKMAKLLIEGGMSPDEGERASLGDIASVSTSCSERQV
ncbi:unnamed protein product [Vitrella brassicaformis CCMP3155]|uniref:Uncharacterized protein n=1 Tax=Vitrella brassicaformis (strain CCMP3155) TaxID=1169540 RepID=A0A0G4FL90_VITBC|nr:unnamed protein product [Vitrella brassicaformis CCMP3155]|eukprot:CEM14761.1 unnamed protein product [Vitrella brassicaformis CCMP3155]